MKNEFYARVISNTHCIKALEAEKSYWERRANMVAEVIHKARTAITKATTEQLRNMGAMAEYIADMLLIVRYRMETVGNDAKLV